MDKRNSTATITELKKNPIKTVAKAGGGSVAITQRNKPVFYCVPAATLAKWLEALEDAELNVIADSRRHQNEITVDFDNI